jgi:putative NIF3 family GTP cyclohydrolase 1 type 2
MIGELENEIQLEDLLSLLKKNFGTGAIRYAGNKNVPIKKIAVCGGSGSFLIDDAIRNKADAFITGDIKYHQFFDNHKKLIIIDIGHYESEQFTKEIFYELLMKKISNFAVHLSEVNTNPLKYYC